MVLKIFSRRLQCVLTSISRKDLTVRKESFSRFLASEKIWTGDLKMGDSYFPGEPKQHSPSKIVVNVEIATN